MIRNPHQFPCSECGALTIRWTGVCEDCQTLAAAERAVNRGTPVDSARAAAVLESRPSLHDVYPVVSQFLKEV